MNFNIDLSSMNEEHEDAMPELDQEHTEQPVQEHKPAASTPGDDHVFVDRGFLDPKSVGYNPARMDLISTDLLAKWLNTSPPSARRRLREQGVFVQKSGRKVLVPRQSAEAMVVRSFVQLEDDDENVDE